MDHLTGIGTGGTISVLPPGHAPLSPIAPLSAAHGTLDERPTTWAPDHALLCSVQERTSQASTELNSALDVAGSPRPIVNAVAYKSGPSPNSSTDRFISTAIEYANPARPSVPRRYSAPTCTKSRTPEGASASIVEDKRFEARL